MKLHPLSLSFLLAVANLGCSGSDPSISASIAKQFDAGYSTPVDLSLVGPPSWSRVCVLGPYSNNEATKKVLGFEWNVEQHSSIGSSDGINLLVFIRDQEVLAFTEHRRDKGDFLKLSPRCLERSKATLVREIGNNGSGQLVTK